MFNVGPGQNMNNINKEWPSIYLSQAIKYKISIKGNLLDFVILSILMMLLSMVKASFQKGALNHAINIGTGKKTTVNTVLT